MQPRCSAPGPVAEPPWSRHWNLKWLLSVTLNLNSHLTLRLERNFNNFSLFSLLLRVVMPWLRLWKCHHHRKCGDGPRPRAPTRDRERRTRDSDGGRGDMRLSLGNKNNIIYGSNCPVNVRVTHHPGNVVCPWYVLPCHNSQVREYQLSSPGHVTQHTCNGNKFICIK